MSHEEALAALLAQMAAQNVRVVKKRGFWHQRAIDRFLRAITFGGMRTYLSDYVTTLGRTIYVPERWEERSAASRYEVLRHELVHVRQFERYTWAGMIVVYGLFPLPMFLAWGRARLEWEAYEETLRCVAALEGMEKARSAQLREEIVRRFTGPDYGYMWPFPQVIRRWIASALDRIEAEGAIAANARDAGG